MLCFMYSHSVVQIECFFPGFLLQSEHRLLTPPNFPTWVVRVQTCCAAAGRGSWKHRWLSANESDSKRNRSRWELDPGLAGNSQRSHHKFRSVEGA
jgi:hypothetical protein